MIIKAKEVYILILFFFISCKKQHIEYFDDGKIKYIKTTENGILHFRRFDQEGNVAIMGKFKDKQLIDTLFARDQDFDYIVKLIVQITNSFTEHIFQNTQPVKFRRFHLYDTQKV